MQLRLFRLNWQTRTNVNEITQLCREENIFAFSKVCMSERRSRSFLILRSRIARRMSGARVFTPAHLRVLEEDTFSRLMSLIRGRRRRLFIFRSGTPQSIQVRLRKGIQNEVSISQHAQRQSK